MRPEFAFAWARFYLANVAMVTSVEPLPVRVMVAFQGHLAPLNSQNTPANVFARLQVIRAKLSQLPEGELGEDETVPFQPLSLTDAANIAQELVSLCDEVARSNCEALQGKTAAIIA